MLPGTCIHGLMPGTCSVCNGTGPMERPEFRGRGVEDDTPRLVKGRDSSAWQGRGQPTSGPISPMNVQKAARNASMYRPIDLRSEWAHENALKSAREYLGVNADSFLERRRYQMAEAQMNVLIRGIEPEPIAHLAMRETEGLKADRLPKNRAPAIPDSIRPDRWHIHHSSDAHKSESERHMRGARNPGRTATRAHFKSRT